MTVRGVFFESVFVSNFMGVGCRKLNCSTAPMRWKTCAWDCLHVQECCRTLCPAIVLGSQLRLYLLHSLPLLCSCLTDSVPMQLQLCGAGRVDNCKGLLECTDIAAQVLAERLACRCPAPHSIMTSVLCWAGRGGTRHGYSERIMLINFQLLSQCVAACNGRGANCACHHTPAKRINGHTLHPRLLRRRFAQRIALTHALLKAPRL